MASCPPTLKLTIPSELRMLPVARAFVDAVCQTCELDPHTTHAVVLATSEAVSNVIRHAHHGRADVQVQVQCQLRPAALEVCLLDEGEPFDINAVPHLDPAELRKTNPDLKIIFVSGYPNDAFKASLGDEDFAFLPKPFSLPQLAAKVKEVLGR